MSESKLSSTAPCYRTATKHRFALRSLIPIAANKNKKITPTIRLRLIFWLRLQVTNSLTGVERYKSDTACIELDCGNNKPQGGMVMSENEHLKREFTDEEHRRLVDYFSLLIEIDQREKARYAKLKDCPKGYAVDGQGRQCGLCFKSVYGDESGWFDKWGFKCSNCQDAVNKRKIPGSLCGDYRHEKSIPDTLLASKLGVSVRTIRKKIKDGRIIGRRIPGGPYIILRKNNPDLINIIKS